MQLGNFATQEMAQEAIRSSTSASGRFISRRKTRTASGRDLQSRRRYRAPHCLGAAPMTGNAGRPRAFAQRPLPSMMIAICRASSRACQRLRSSDPEGFFLILLHQTLVDPLDVIVGQMLNVVLQICRCSSCEISLSFSSLRNTSTPSRRTLRNRYAGLLGIFGRDRVNSRRRSS